MTPSPAKPSRPPRRRLPAWQFYGLIFAAFVPFAVAAELLGGADQNGRHIGLQPGWVAALLLLSGVVTILVWRRLDEAAREAHKWAWYWGGSAGMLVVLSVFLLGDGAQVAARLGLTNSFEDGIVAVLGLEVIGYLVAWSYWWLRRR